MSTTRPPAYQQTAGQVEASRRGAHRARAKPVLAGLPIIAGVLVVLAAVGGVYYVLGDRGTDSSPSVEAASPGGTTATATPTAGSSAGATSDPQTSTGTSDGANGGTTGSTDGDTTAEVDKTIPVRVLNSLAVAGLAKRVADDVEQEGWTVKDTGNSVNKNLDTTKVYYGTKKAKVSAQGLVKDLGFGTIVPDPDVAQGNLVVVLGQDAT